MFEFEPDGMYQMPVHFGPCCGPRRGPDGERLYKKGPQESTQHTIVYETDPEAVAPFLPEGFEVRMPYIIAIHKMHRNLPWLAGRGYNVMCFNVPVTYHGKKETIVGQYQLAIWENHADPIISGREQLGYAKIFADIKDIDPDPDEGGSTYTALSSWGFEFLKLEYNFTHEPDESDMEILNSVLFDPDNEGLMHYKYIPRSEAPFNKPDVAYISLTPKKFTLPENAVTEPLPPQERIWGNGSISWNIPQWEDMPTQYHIVQGLASIPVKRVVGATRAYMKHYNDVYNEKVIEI